MPTSQWEGRDPCWEWVKKIGCYDFAGMLSWEDGQKDAAKLGLAPDPGALPLQPLRSPSLCERYELGVQVDAAPGEAESAREWFQNNVAVYVINLELDTARWRSISSQLASFGIVFQRVNGVDLSRPGAFEEAASAGLIPKTFNWTVAQQNALHPKEAMGGIAGTAGCAAAHLHAMKVALEERDRRSLALVLEDDVVLSPDFFVRARRLLQEEVPCDWKAISLKSKCPFGECVSPQLLRVLPDGNAPDDSCRRGVNYGFYAMLYRLDSLDEIRGRLTNTVFNEERPHCLDVDVALASISDEVPYYAVPSMQRPGFLTEGSHGSTRDSLNRKAGWPMGDIVTATGAPAFDATVTGAPTTVRLA